MPVPVTISESALPSVQPGRSTISCSTEARSGVCWSTPRAPTVGQPAGLQATAAAVRVRPETSFDAVVKPGASSVACPAMVRLAGAVCGSSVSNCT